jgi:hypothetical protein
VEEKIISIRTQAEKENAPAKNATMKTDVLAQQTIVEDKIVSIRTQAEKENAPAEDTTPLLTI